MLHHRAGGRPNVLTILESVPVDDQFSSPRQCNYSSVLGKVLVCASTTVTHARNPDSSFYSKYSIASYAIDSDSSYIFGAGPVALQRRGILDPAGTPTNLAINSIRMIDFQSDPTYGYVTSNNATDGHGVRMVRKSDMTVVASLLATGSGDGQFNNPLGVKKYGEFVYVADRDNVRIVKLNASDLSFVANITPGTGGNWIYDMCTDGTYWYCSGWAGGIFKLDMNFAALTPAVKIVSKSYSIALIPDQGDGYGTTLCSVSDSDNIIKRHRCDTLALITTVGSSGTGADSLCDPVITGAAGLYITQEDQISAASGAAPAKNGFTGYFFRSAGPHRDLFRPTGGKSLRDITAIDASDDKVIEIKNLHKCVNMTSLKLQTNVGLKLFLSTLTGKMVTLWAYGCGTGVSGSIRHMTALTSCNLRENAATQATVDGWIADLYANKDVMATCTVNFNGTNSAPSAAGKAMADELVADYSWSFAYTP